jgi:hypothetical protein
LRILRHRPDRKILNREIVEPDEEAAPVTAAMTLEQAGDQADPLDALLIDAALGSVRRFAPDTSRARPLAALSRRPRTLARRPRSLASESGRIAPNTSPLATATPYHPRTKWGSYAGGDYGAGAGSDGESDLALVAVPEHADPETVMARMRALA